MTSRSPLIGLAALCCLLALASSASLGASAPIPLDTPEPKYQGYFNEVLIAGGHDHALPNPLAGPSSGQARWRWERSLQRPIPQRALLLRRPVLGLGSPGFITITGYNPGGVGFPSDP